MENDLEETTQLLDFADLPVELRENICRYLDVNTLLRMCCVSKSWNRSVTSLNSVWRQKCPIHLHSSNFTKNIEWKTQTVHSIKLLKQVKDGTAFRPRLLDCSCLTKCDRIAGMDYSDGLLVVYTHIHAVMVWRLSDDKLMDRFVSPRTISCVALQGGQTLALGEQGGGVGLEPLDSAGRRLHTGWWCEGHCDRVTSVSVSPCGLVVGSAGRDGRACLWCTHSGRRLREIQLGHGGWAHILLSDANHLFYKEPDRVTLVTFSDECHDTTSTAVQGRYIPGCVLRDENLLYMDDTSGGPVIIAWNVNTGDCTHVSVCGAVKRFLAAGEHLALLHAVDGAGHDELAVVNVHTGQRLGGCRLNHDREIRDIQVVVVGETRWLSALEQWPSDKLIVAYMGSVRGVQQLIAA